jgi:hypothetical protein
MTRIPALSREETDAEQQKVYDETVETTARVGRGPSVGYAYAPGLWRIHNASSAHRVADDRAPLERGLPVERASGDGAERGQSQVRGRC